MDLSLLRRTSPSKIHYDSNWIRAAGGKPLPYGFSVMWWLWMGTQQNFILKPFLPEIKRFPTGSNRESDEKP